ncbi:uncharacterized protein F5147DRAFT_674718 [Suillus discolor]|uniref:Uncharacterized protein n=1 Tax=Suillus discolor TaxID=1912936 RepID=A0A9P7FH13_9AGAM|nr:uncharacterized protein F5147DRAFT_674718 [Suillus discolor]KAG2115810.1 hypothetical protein F5147DRAFT_674718 [Suillus discolor]
MMHPCSRSKTLHRSDMVAYPYLVLALWAPTCTGDFARSRQHLYKFNPNEQQRHRPTSSVDIFLSYFGLFCNI